MIERRMAQRGEFVPRMADETLQNGQRRYVMVSARHTFRDAALRLWRIGSGEPIVDIRGRYYVDRLTAMYERAPIAGPGGQWIEKGRYRPLPPSGVGVTWTPHGARYFDKRSCQPVVMIQGAPHTDTALPAFGEPALPERQLRYRPIPAERVERRSERPGKISYLFDRETGRLVLEGHDGYVVDTRFIPTHSNRIMVKGGIFFEAGTGHPIVRIHGKLFVDTNPAQEIRKEQDKLTG